MSKPWQRERSRIALLVLFGIGVGIALGEIVARSLWTAPWYERLIQEQRGERELGVYRKNAKGLRDQDYGPKPPGRRRVLLLGDSFTHGLGVLDESKIFPEILERQLGEMDRFPGGVDLLNAGRPGSLTREWLGLYRWAAREFEPDVVVIVFFLRDGTTLGSNPNFFGPIRREIVLRNTESLLYRFSCLYRLWRDRVDRRLVAERYTRELIDAYLGDEQQTEEWFRAGLNLWKLRGLVERKGAKLGFVIFPILAELHDDYPFKPVTDLLEVYATEGLRVPLHNLLPAFLGRHGPDLWVSPLNQHPNEKGHAIAAESLLPFVVELLSDEESSEAR